jgi:uncharacterized protein (DUF1800 family)
MTLPVSAFIAANRFGRGAAPGELAAASIDPKAWLKSQLAAAPETPAAFADLSDSADVLVEQISKRPATKALRVQPGTMDGPAKLGPATLDLPKAGAGNTGSTMPERAKPQPAMAAALSFGMIEYQRYVKEAEARILAQVQSRQPLRERLVAFWSNHFTVSIARTPVTGLVGAFEREAIRPHVTGRFHDLLLAAVRHPAMLMYLDNAGSTGPRSPLGLRRALGLNENLARELLELHTLGVDGGYTQTDVTQFARILTGWSYANPQEKGAGGFAFRPARHEPGVKILLGHRFAEGGEKEGLDALALLARHPSTARHLARQFATHFIAEDPPPAVVDRFAEVFRKTDGDLTALTLAAIDAPEAWAQPLAKVKSPNEFVVASLRATAAPLSSPGEIGAALGALKGLGQMPFAALSPAGWPDRADGWIGPDAVMDRADFAAALSRRLRGRLDPNRLREASVGPVTSRALTQALAHAASVEDANALVLASAEFQRR